MTVILVLYDTVHGSTKQLANKIAQGISASGCEAMLRRVPKVSASFDKTASDIPDDGDPFVQLDDLSQCDGLAMGSPTRFGNMSSAMKYFWDGTASQWLSGELIDKPGAVFTSSSSMHGGQETTLVSMMFPLLHQGMILVGLPYSEPDLHTTQSGGSPYGASHVSRGQHNETLTEEEARLAIALGKRLADTAKKLGKP